jgi:hypothetical protein
VSPITPFPENTPFTNGLHCSGPTSASSIQKFVFEGLLGFNSTAYIGLGLIVIVLVILPTHHLSVTISKATGSLPICEVESGNFKT